MHAVEAHNTHAQLLTLGATANMYVQRRGQKLLVTVLSQPLLAYVCAWFYSSSSCLVM